MRSPSRKQQHHQHRTSFVPSRHGFFPNGTRTAHRSASITTPTTTSNTTTRRVHSSAAIFSSSSNNHRNINGTPGQQQLLLLQQELSELVTKTIMRQSADHNDADSSPAPEDIHLQECLKRYQQQEEQEQDATTIADTMDMVVVKELGNAFQNLELWEKALVVQRVQTAYYSQCIADDATESSSHSYSYIDSLHGQGKLHLRLGDFRLSKNCYDDVLEHYQSTIPNEQEPEPEEELSSQRRDLGHIHISLAGWYFFQDPSDHPTALDHLSQAEEQLTSALQEVAMRGSITTIEKENDTAESSTNLLLMSIQRMYVKCLDNQGLIHRLSLDFATALDCYQRAFELVTSHDFETVHDNDDDDDIVLKQTLSLHIGDMLVALDRPEEALQVYEELVDSATRTNNRGIQGVLWHSIASIHASQGDYDMALEEFQRSLQIKQVTGGDNNPEVARTLNSLGALYAGALDDKVQAIECFQQALLITRINVGEENAKTDHDVLAIIKNITVMEQDLAAEKAQQE